MDRPLVALSVRQPWANAIIQFGKDIENRTRCHRHRGLTLIHASGSMTADECDDAERFARERDLPTNPVSPPFGVLPLGCIIGAVDILDCVTESDSPWWMGPCGYVLANPRPLPLITCRGTVTPLFWVPPPEVRAEAARALGIPA